nr:copia protein [Tanacetum cinerariifolium]
MGEILVEISEDGMKRDWLDVVYIQANLMTRLILFPNFQSLLSTRAFVHELDDEFCETMHHMAVLGHLKVQEMHMYMVRVWDEVRESIDDIKYHGMIGSLLYLTATRSDIMFSVCLCARFQKVPKTSHLEAVKRIFRYIKGTTHLGLWYPKGTGVEMIIYADFNHAGDYVDRKSKSGVCTFMGCFLTSWFSKKQTALAISTTEAEYVFAEKAFQQDYG